MGASVVDMDLDFGYLQPDVAKAAVVGRPFCHARASLESFVSRQYSQAKINLMTYSSK